MCIWCSLTTKLRKCILTSIQERIYVLVAPDSREVTVGNESLKTVLKSKTQRYQQGQHFVENATEYTQRHLALVCLAMGLTGASMNISLPLVCSGTISVFIMPSKMFLNNTTSTANISCTN